CDAKRNVLVYLSYTDKIIDGSPENSTSTVPIMPWGNLPAPKCADFLTQ
ncbi:MAG: CreA family protein, partial [Aestuariivirga sp.]